jgi:Protein of unknown function (DUF3800)
MAPMTDVFMYADETGNLDYNLVGGGSKYFGIGTATWHGDPGEHLWQAERMRFAHAAAGFETAKGYHAKDDSRSARVDVYDLIKQQAPRFDMTFLAKDNAYANVRAQGQIYLYQMAWYLHFKEIGRWVTSPGDTLSVAVATLGTAARRMAFRRAIEDVCQQAGPLQVNVQVAQWDSATSWGLQVADYGLWAVQRRIERGDESYMAAVAPTLATEFRPWGRAT